MNKETRILSIFVTLAFLLGAAGTTISIVNNHLIRSKVIKPSRFLMMRRSLAQRPWKGQNMMRPGMQLQKGRQWQQTPQGRVPKRGLEKRGGALPRGELRERLQSLAREKEKREKRLVQMIGRLNKQLKEQEEAIKKLSHKVENLENKIEDLQ